jgi:hypothetical protein
VSYRVQRRIGDASLPCWPGAWSCASRSVRRAIVHKLAQCILTSLVEGLFGSRFLGLTLVGRPSFVPVASRSQTELAIRAGDQSYNLMDREDLCKALAKNFELGLVQCGIVCRCQV